MARTQKQTTPTDDPLGRLRGEDRQVLLDLLVSPADHREIVCELIDLRDGYAVVKINDLVRAYPNNRVLEIREMPQPMSFSSDTDEGLQPDDPT